MRFSVFLVLILNLVFSKDVRYKIQKFTDFSEPNFCPIFSSSTALSKVARKN